MVWKAKTMSYHDMYISEGLIYYFDLNKNTDWFKAYKLCKEHIKPAHDMSENWRSTKNTFYFRRKEDMHLIQGLLSIGD